jgi:hypothetical protein
MMAKKERKIDSWVFTDDEIDGMPRYTEAELAALPEPWTKRGDMLPDDKHVIRGTVDNCLPAARIFVSGEAAEENLGEIAVKHLMNVNDVYYENGAGAEPLFVQTRRGTICMLRFDPRFVWRCFHPDVLVEAVQAEVHRLGVKMDPWKMDYFDFYQNMTAAMKEAADGEAVAMVRGDSTEDFYHGVYLSCLLLFGKPGYMDVPVAEHFAQKEAADFVRGAEVYRLNDAALVKLEELRKAYGGLKALTNPEVSFVVDLYEKALK